MATGRKRRRDPLKTFGGTLQQAAGCFLPENESAFDIEKNARKYACAYAEILTASVGTGENRKVPSEVHAAIERIQAAEQKESSEIRLGKGDYTLNKVGNAAIAELEAIKDKTEVKPGAGLFANVNQQEACIAALNTAWETARSGRKYEGKRPLPRTILAAMTVASGLPLVDDPEFFKKTADVHNKIQQANGPIDYKDVSSTFYNRLASLITGLVPIRERDHDSQDIMFKAEFKSPNDERSGVTVTKEHWKIGLPEEYNSDVSRDQQGDNPPLLTLQKNCETFKQVGVIPFGINEIYDSDGKLVKSGHALIMTLQLDPDPKKAYALEVRLCDPNASSLQVAEADARGLTDNIATTAAKDNYPNGWCQTFSWFEAECAMMGRNDIHNTLVDSFTAPAIGHGRDTKQANTTRAPSGTMMETMISSLVPKDEHVIGCRVEITGPITGYPVSRADLEASAIVRKCFEMSDRRVISGIENEKLAPLLNGKTCRVLSELPAADDRVTVRVGDRTVNLKISALTGIHADLEKGHPVSPLEGEIISLGRNNTDGTVLTYIVKLDVDGLPIEVPVSSVDVTGQGPAFGNVLSYFVRALAVRYRVLYDFAKHIYGAGIPIGIPRSPGFGFPYIWAAQNRQHVPVPPLESTASTGERDAPEAKLMTAVMVAYLDKRFPVTVVDYNAQSAFTDLAAMSGK